MEDTLCILQLWYSVILITGYLDPVQKHVSLPKIGMDKKQLAKVKNNFFGK